MNKEDILARSRREGQDEGVEYALSRGRKIGFNAMAITYLAITIFNISRGQSNHQVFALFFAYLGFEHLGRYRVTKQKSSLVLAVISILAGAIYGASYVLSVLGVFHG